MSITLTTGAKALRKGLRSYGDFRDRQAVKAYDALLSIAEDGDKTISAITDDSQKLPKKVKKARKKGAKLLEEARDEAGTLTREAHERIEEAIASLDSKARDYRRDAADVQERAIAQSRLISRRTRRRAAEAGRKSAEKAHRKYDQRAKRDRGIIKTLNDKDGTTKKRRSAASIIGGVVVVGAAAGAVALWWANRGNKPVGTTPPRVEEFAGDHGKAAELVYSTPDDHTDTTTSSAPREVTGVDPAGHPEPGNTDVPTDDLTPQERTALGGAHRLRED